MFLKHAAEKSRSCEKSGLRKKLPVTKTCLRTHNDNRKTGRTSARDQKSGEVVFDQRRNSFTRSRDGEGDRGREFNHQSRRNARACRRVGLWKIHAGSLYF